MNKLNKKIISLFITLFLILNISCGYKVFSSVKVEKDDENYKQQSGNK